MSFTAYFVDSAILADIPKGFSWHATPVPADPTKQFVVIEWRGDSTEFEFEMRAGVEPLGAPWEPVSADHATLLASMQDQSGQPASALPAPLTPVLPAAPDIVSSALRKITWAGGRLVR